MSFLAGGLPDGKDYSLVVLPAPDLQGPSCWKSAECNFRRIAGLSHAWGWWASDGCRILRGVMHRSREKAMATHSSTLAWKIPWTEEPGRLWSMGSLSRTRLSNFTFFIHFHSLEKAMATHSSALAWRIPGTVEPGGLPSMGSHRVGHD